MGVWYGRRVEVGMGVLHLMRVMIISYFMTVICVGRGGVGGYRYILITFYYHAIMQGYLNVGKGCDTCHSEGHLIILTFLSLFIVLKP